MTADAFSPNFRLLPKEPDPVTEETPEQSWPKPRGAHFSFTAAILIDHPHLADIFRGTQVRPPTPDEAAMYEQRLSDPKWAWLLALVGETHPLPAPVAAGPEPADPAQPGEDVSPQPPEAPEPAPDATQAPNPDEALLPPVEAPTALLPAVQDEEEQA
jgi:hypothetical protein